jgi:hypothetical protein
LYDTHAVLNWRLKHVQHLFQTTSGQAPAERTESSHKFDFVQERLKRISALPDTVEELALEKQVALNVAKMQAYHVGRLRFGEQFGKSAARGAAAAAAAAASLYESEGGVGPSQPGAAAGGAGTGGLRRGDKLSTTHRPNIFIYQNCYNHHYLLLGGLAGLKIGEIRSPKKTVKTPE